MKCRHQDNAFMGATHALSAVAVSLLLIAFIPKDMLVNFLNTDSVLAVLLCVFVAVGASLLPDLDNTTSTSINALGVVGKGLSVFFRTTSAFIQTTIRLPRDDSQPNPHRGFYHTIPASAGIGFLAYLATTIGGSINLPFIGEMKYGNLIALIIIWINIHLSFYGLFKPFMKKIEKKSGILGDAGVFVFSFFIVYTFFSLLPTDLNFWWVGVGIAVGMIIHILGDSCTTAGVPILFPLPYKGKLWWNVRILPVKIKAGGPIENYVMVPFFAVLSIISIVFIFINYGNIP